MEFAELRGDRQRRLNEDELRATARRIPPVAKEDKRPPVDVWAQGDYSTKEFVARTIARQILNGNPERKYFMIQNLSSGAIYVGFDATATRTSLRLDPGERYEPRVAPINAISVLASGGALSGVIIEA